MQKEATELKNAQKNANPDIPEAELLPLEWSMNLKVLEAGVGRRAGKEIRGLGRAVSYSHHLPLHVLEFMRWRRDYILLRTWPKKLRRLRKKLVKR